MFNKRSTLQLAVLLLLLGTAQCVYAHAVLMDSTPKPNSTVKGPELDVKLRFNVRIDGKRSRIRLVAPDGVISTLTLDNSPAPEVLQSHVKGLKPGAYKLQWQVLASDGHITRGDVPFNVT